MRNLLPVMIFLTGCSTEANHIGNPLLLPITGAATVLGNAVYSQRRGRVEVIVKSNHDAIVQDISNGTGPVLTEAMDAAAIPMGDRPARTLQLQGDLGLYASNPEALVVALMVYGG